MKHSIFQKICTWIFAVLFVCFGSYLIVDCFFISKDCLPEFNITNFLDGSYQKNLNENINKNITIYKPLKLMKTDFGMLVGKSFVNGVYIKDSSLIQIPKFPNSLDLKFVAEQINNFNGRINQPIYSLIITTKIQMDNDQFMSYIFKGDEYKLISEYEGFLDNNIYKLDAISPLTYIKNLDVFYKTESRLTSLGSFLIYTYNMKQLGVSPLSMKQFSIEHVANDFYGELYNKTLYSKIDPDNIDLFHYNGYAVKGSVESIYSDNSVVNRSTIYDLSQNYDNCKINIIFGDSAPIKNVSTNSKSNNSILIFADRNIDSLIQFLAIHYSKITVINLSELTELKNDLKDSIKKVNASSYNQVLFAYGIESLINMNQFRGLEEFNLS